MNMNISGDIANLLKLPLKIMLAIALASGLILFYLITIFKRCTWFHLGINMVLQLALFSAFLYLLR